jgi:hypothetical protein
MMTAPNALAGNQSNIAQERKPWAHEETAGLRHMRHMTKSKGAYGLAVETGDRATVVRSIGAERPSMSYDVSVLLC